MTHQPYKHTDLPKGYITYPIDINTSEGEGLAAMLYDHKKEGWHKISIGNDTWYESHVPLKLCEIVRDIGGKVEKIHIPTLEGKKQFTIKDQFGKDKTIGVQIRTKKKSKDKRSFEAEIRVTGNTPEELLFNINGMRDHVLKWGIKPRTCMWSAGAWKETKILTRPSDIAKQEKADNREQARLEKIIADMQDKISALEKPSVRKTIREDRKVMNGILS